MKMESPGSGNGSQIFTSLKYQRTFIAKYYGRTLVERWHTQPMLSWIVAEVKRLGNPRAETVFLTITDASIRGVSVKFGRTVFEHKIKAITKFTQTTDDQKCFAYLAKEIASDISLCHVFQAADETSVSQLFKTLREIVQESSQQSLLPFCMETTGTVPIDALQTGQSQQFEVLYVGKIKVTQKRAQPMFVDDATDKFLDIEFQRQKICLKSNPPVSGQSIKSEILGMKSDLSELSDEDIDPGGVPKRRLSDTVLEEMLHPLQISVDQVNADTVHGSNGEKNGEPSARRQSSSSIENTSPALCQTSLLSPPAHSLITHTQSLDTPGRTSVLRDLQNFSFTPDQCCSVVEDGSLHRQTSLPPINPKFFAASPVGFLRPRADSNPFTTMDSCHYNRTMLFLISCSNVCLISTDKKQILFHKDFGDISHCSQGVKHPEHFGIVCRETTLTGMDIYVGYIFQCEAERVVNEIMKTLKQAFHCAFQTSQEKLISNKTFKFCDGCPLYWFHKLCCDIEGLSIEKVQTAVMLQIASLSEREQKDIMSKYQATVVQSQEEQNVVFMMLLRALCEQKQMRHTHIASKQPVKQEAGRKGGLSSFDSFKSMAKKSFPSPFESIFKHSASETSTVTDTFREMTVMKTHSLPLSASRHPEKRASPVHKDVVHPIPNPIAATVLSKNKKTSRVENSETLSKKDEVKSLVTIESSKSTLSATSSVASHPVTGERSLSDTAAVLHDLQLEKSQSKISKCSQSLAHSDLRLNEMTKVSSKASLSPLRNIFLKVGTQNRSSTLKGIKEQHSESKKGSWRKSIFYRVQTPVERNVTARGEPVREQMKDNGNDYAKRSSAALRALWKKAIMDQILLIRMEKENKRLQVGQDITFQKRVKLQYDIVRPCPEDAGEKWEKIINSSETVGYSLLEEAVKYGVPLVKRGEIWHFLSQQHCLGRKPPPMDQTPYMELLKRLTPYQHAILIDIGRTYPSHPYYKYSLSPGQLSLFSILKAYSLLDEDVGYCQGLSFLAGVILLHMPEGRAFEMMKHIMFVLGFRNQYKPDMAALQIQMYQLARLTHDFIPEINDHFDRLDISPGLYAAPWFLTFFASHFPIGFVARLLDMVFLQGMNAVFKVAVLLLKIHKPQILACTSFETVVDFLKTTLPSSGHIGMEKVLDEVLMVDVHHQLQTYQIEYMVLKEEMTQQAKDIEPEKAHALETDNKELQRLNMELSEQLQVAQNNVSTLEASVASYQSTVKRLEMRVRSLQDERDALHHSVNILRKRLDNLEMTKTEKPLVEAIPPENCSYDKPILPTNGLSTSEKNSQLDPVNYADQVTVTEA